MRELNQHFSPDWASPPGGTILDLLEERDWSQADLASRLGCSEKHTSHLINGKVSLTSDIATKLERVLGSSAQFWLNLEANYQQRLARLKAEQDNKEWDEWINNFPVKELMACGALTKQKLTASNKPHIVDEVLSFFGVATPDQWRAFYGDMQVSFRRTREEQSDIGAISSWLRLGELVAEQTTTPKFNKTRFEESLKEIRKLTTLSFDEFHPEIAGHLTKSGVVYAVVPAIKRAHVSGVARWLSPTKPVIQLSLYGKTNDKFWFSFFHEAAHILLHSTGRQEKKSIFLDDPNATNIEDVKEKEANKWAGEFLIPSEFDEILPQLQSKSQVTAFAKHINLHPGIVVGRLQHEGYIPLDWMNGLKTSLALPAD